MSTIIHTEDIFPLLERELKVVQTELLVISAFVKVEALRKIDFVLKDKSILKKLLVRFRKEDIQYGSTDLELYRYCKENGWDLYINLDLHSKIFVFDKSQYVIGSANVTLSGLGIAKNSNIETVCKGFVTQEEYSKIIMFFENSSLLTQKLYNLMEEQIIDSHEQRKNDSWNSEILNLTFKPPLQLWVSEMIFSSSPYDMNSTDRALLNMTLDESANILIVKSKFISSKCYRWLIASFDSEIYFGELSYKLHNAIIDNPSPYRKDIKILLKNMLNWISELEIEEIKIDRPNYSQRLKKYQK